MPSLHRLHPLPRLPHRFPPPSSSSSSRLLTTSLPRSSAWKAALLPSLTSNTVPTDDFSPHPSSSTSSLPDRIVALGVPFVKDEGFTLQAVLRGVREAGKGEERVGKEVLEGLFPDQEVLTFRRVFEEMTKRFRPSDESPPYPSSSDPSPSSSSAQDDTATGTIALRRALVQAWLDEARRATVRHVREKGLTIEKDGEEGVAEGFRERLRWNATNPRSTLVDVRFPRSTPPLRSLTLVAGPGAIDHPPAFIFDLPPPALPDLPPLSNTLPPRLPFPLHFPPSRPARLLPLDGMADAPPPVRARLDGSRGRVAQVRCG